MLLDFKFKNFTSFRDEAMLSAETGERLSKYKETNTFYGKDVSLLKNLLVFGANGAGKSQIFKALGIMQLMVLHDGTQTVTQNLPYTPFAFNEKNRTLPTEFTIRIKLDDAIYEYSITYNLHSILKEKLTITRKSKELVYFAREKDGIKKVPDNLNDVTGRLRDNGLLLYLAQQENDEISSKVYKWFANDLMFVDTNNQIPNSFLKLMNIPELKKEMVAFLNFADFNITNVKVRQVSVNYPSEALKLMQQLSNNIPKSAYQLFTIHKKYDSTGNIIGDQELPLSEESLGTQKLFFIVLAMISSQIHGNNKTLLIDEFDDSLHHDLASSLVDIFNTKTNNNQYIVSTHDFQLLDNGIRVDQIYFVEKDFRGGSNLKSAFDFTDSRTNARRDAHFAKKYIQGRYGGVPVIDTDGLIRVLKNVNRNIGGSDYGTEE